MVDLEPKAIHSEEELSFAIFCIENVANRLGVGADRVYRALTEKSDIMNRYIIPCYEVLHSQSREYIVEDIISLMEERSVHI